ncbi:5'-nucleotidase C-terminal domain-containing protein [Maledivibacter halophilus]|uniref:2',3'-cyclic-nucleotide 2'-phosphodiesterase / 3'-nucleotidase n=1 Tax=Maledivibacter halophilus TaxID=36842 RepID=A0A1T5LD36_9FIRM|nr:5'-nucleotidase C-terminal domain-containing protein [Maledivibacter halophilus]SKC73615.1 2',3'-cyclic-nucleotide 2'-phosphodiesterase / 3'-nucleotidase [Maledivibacter halophilus]
MNFFKKATGMIVLTLLLVTSLFLNPALVNAEETEETTITILGTTDIHGRIYPHDYATDSEDDDAGFAKIYTLVNQEREKNPNTILIDCGDVIQDNSAELFNDMDVHPMVQAMNTMKYDTWTLGNHEFNFQKSFLEKNINAFNNTVLAANIYKEDGTRFVDPYTIIEKDGVRVAIVGLIPPHIPTWEASSPEHFEGLNFSDPLEESKKVIKELEGKYDILIGALHLGKDAEYGSTGGMDIAQECPEFDVLFLGHAHATLNEEINGVKIIEPGSYGWALAKADIRLVKNEENWEVASIDTANLETKDLSPSQEILDKFEYVHTESVADANKIVGEITKDFIERPDYITGDDEITTIPTSQIQDTAVIDLINEVQTFYAKSDISSAALFNFGSNLKQGDFKKKDVAFIYKYANTLNGVNITGENLKKYMEWSVSYYNTYKDGDVTVSFNPEIRGYNYDMFSGMTYDIDISEEAGNRIKNLLISGEPLDETKVYKLALNNYRLGTLLNNGWVTNEDKYYDSYEELQDSGRIRDLIIKYVQEEKGGKIEPKVDNNWKIIGTDFDKEKQEIVFEKVRNGEIEIPTSEDGRTLNVVALNYDELMAEGKLEAPDSSSDKETTDLSPAEEITKQSTVSEAVESETTTYTVKSGDVLWKIAEKFNTTWKKLADLNNLKNPNLIITGQNLIVPAN